MDKEYVILNYIHRDGHTTQREIAVDTGISVGAVNLLLKNMAQKGLVKMERLNAKTLRYILTPKGMQEKLRLTYTYARASFRRITSISEGAKALVEERVIVKDSLKEVVLFGPEDEVRKIIMMGLSGTDVSCRCIGDPETLERYLEGGKVGGLFFVWRMEEEGFLAGRGCDVVNVLGRVEF